MSEQAKALELANLLDVYDGSWDLADWVTTGAAAELRRLHSVNAELLEALQETDKDLTVLLSNLADAEKRDPKWAGMRDVVSAWRERNRAALARALGQ